MEFKRGKPTGALKKLGAARGSGTTRLLPARPHDLPAHRLQPGDHPRAARGRELPAPRREGPASSTRPTARRSCSTTSRASSDYLKKILERAQGARPVHDPAVHFEKDNGLRLEAALPVDRSRPTSTCAATSTASPRARAARTRTASARPSARPCATTSRRTSSRRAGSTLSADDIREGMVGVLSVFIAEPQFQGQTKDRLNNPEVQSLVDGALRPSLEQWLNSNRTVAEQIVGAHRPRRRARVKRRARRLGRRLAQDRRPAGGSRLPGKLSDCTSSGGDDRALHRRGRLRRRLGQAGPRPRTCRPFCRCAARCSNTEALALGKVLENKELADLVTALGCGVGKTFDISQAALREGRAPRRRRLRRPPHHDAAAHVLLPAPAGADQEPVGVRRRAAAVSHRHRQGVALGGRRRRHGSDPGSRRRATPRPRSPASRAWAR